MNSSTDKLGEKEEEKPALFQRLKHALRSSPKTTEDMVAIVDAARENDVIDNDAIAIDTGIVEGVENESGPFEFVLEVRGMDEDGAIKFLGEIDVFFEDRELVLGVFVETNFSDAKDVRLVDEIGDQGHHLAGKDGIFGLLGIDAEPTEMLDAELGGPGGFVFGELTIVIVESLG